MERKPNFETLLAAGPWREIPRCPGRRVWPGPSAATPADLVGAGTPVKVFEVAGAPDPVHVVALVDGGLISYRKKDGRFIHTLNTPEGFARKLEELGVRLDVA